MGVLTALGAIAPQVARTVNAAGVALAFVVSAATFFYFFLIPWCWRFRASTLFKRGEYFSAVAAFDKALMYSPKDARILLGRGVALHRLGRLDDALTSLRKANYLVPLQSRVARELASVLRELKRYREAIETIDAILDADEWDWRARLARCSIEVEARLLDDALEDCERLLTSDSETIASRAYMTRGIVHLALGKQEDALADFETAYLIDPKTEEILEYFIITWSRNGLFDQMEALCDAVLKDNPENSFVVSYRKSARLRKKRDD